MQQITPQRMLSVAGVLAIAILLAATSIGLRVSLARAQEAPSADVKAKVTFSTEPSPAQKGSNAVRVRLTDAAGKPISGADVTVTFFMAAMPSMNMPAMKTSIKATDKGGGTYEGKGDLASGGMWQVTITAKQNGQTIANRKLTVKANAGARASGCLQHGPLGIS